MRTDLFALASAPRIARRIFSRSSSGPLLTPRASTWPHGSRTGNHWTPCSRSPVANFQSSTKTSCMRLMTGPSNAKLPVLNRVRRLVGAPVIVGDIDAAGEADAAIDDEDLAVITKIGVFEAAGEPR